MEFNNETFNGAEIFFNGEDEILEEKQAFCRQENLEACMRYLFKEFSNMGLVGTTEWKPNPSDVHNLVNMTNAVFELVQINRRNSRNQDEIEKNYSKINCDLHHYQSSVLKLRDSVEQKSRLICTLQEKERQLESRNKSLQSNLKAEKDEMKRICSILQQRDAQYRHESRKTERELAKLKERIHQLHAEKCSEKRYGMIYVKEIEVLNPVAKDGSRSKWRRSTNLTEKSIEEFYHMSMKNLEDRCKNLMEETKALRTTLYKLNKEMQSVLYCNENNNEEGASNNEDSLDQETPASIFEMPYLLVQETVTVSMDKKLVQIKSQLNKLKKIAGNQSSSIDIEEVNQLKERIRSYQDLVSHQEDALQTLLMPSNSVDDEIMDSYVLEQRAAMEKDKQYLNEQRANFEKERKIYTDAAVRLAQEKKLFEQKTQGKKCFCKESEKPINSTIDHSVIPKSTEKKPLNPLNKNVPNELTRHPSLRRQSFKSSRKFSLPN